MHGKGKTGNAFFSYVSLSMKLLQLISGYQHAENVFQNMFLVLWMHVLRFWF